MTNEGDTKAALALVYSDISCHCTDDAHDARSCPVFALDLITTTLSEQEAELERYREALERISARLTGIPYSFLHDATGMANIARAALTQAHQRRGDE